MPSLLWTRDEIVLLLRAWEEVRPYIDDTERAHCARVYARFVELCGGDTPRTEQAVYLQRSSLTFNHRFITNYDQESKHNGASGTWFSLSPRGREQVFHSSEHKSYRYLDFNQEMYAAMSRIKKQQPLKKRKNMMKNQSEISSSAETRLIAAEWTYDELANLVRAWWDEVKDCQSHLGSKQAAKIVSARIYERFMILCHGGTARTQAAAITKKNDLAQSYRFIFKINEQQRKTKHRGWFSMSKLEKLAILRAVERSGHLSDMPEDIFARVGAVLAEERALGLIRRQRDEENDDEDEESTSDDDDENAVPSPRSKLQVKEERSARHPGRPRKNQKLSAASAADRDGLTSQYLLTRRRLVNLADGDGGGDHKQSLKQRVIQYQQLQMHHDELFQMADVLDKQSRRLRQIAYEMQQVEKVATGGPSAVRERTDCRSQFVARSASRAWDQSEREGCERQSMAKEESYEHERSNTCEVQDDLRRTRSLAQETILQLQNQGSRGSSWCV